MENVDADEGRGAALAPLYRHEGRRILTNKLNLKIRASAYLIQYSNIAARSGAQAASARTSTVLVES